MKSLKKLLSLVLCLTMVLSAFAIVPVVAGAAEADVAVTAEVVGDYECGYGPRGVLIFEYLGMGGDITIPSTIKGRPVADILNLAFALRDDITSVVFPHTSTEMAIWNGAFGQCTNLSSIVISDSVDDISLGAFTYCTGLKSITIDPGNPVYDSRDNCNAIIVTESNKLYLGCMDTVIPDTVTSIGAQAFGGCTGLTSIDIPDSVTSIGRYAFMLCTGLTYINIPDSVTDIARERDSNADYETIPRSIHICCSPGSAAEAYAKYHGNSYGHDYVLTPIDSDSHCGVCSICGSGTEPEAHSFTDGVCSCGYKEALLNGLVDGYFYINGELAKGKGLVEFEGNIYFVKNDGSVYTSGTLKVVEAKTNGLLPAGSYSFDAAGKLVTDGIINGYYYVNGEKVKGAGVVEYKDNFYFVTNNGSVYTNGRLKVAAEKTNGLLPAASYNIDENGKILCNGIINGYFYIDGDKAKGAGVVEYAKNLYFVRNNGTLYKNGRLSVPENKTNGLVVAAAYNFDADGKMQDVKRIVNGYYYLNGQKVPGAGIIEINGDLYFVKNNGAVYTSGRLAVPEAKTNGLVPAGAYTFGADGKMVK